MTTLSRIPKKVTAISLFTAALVSFTACVNQDSEKKKNYPTAAMAKATHSNLSEIGEGHAIYMRHCSQCHEPKLPSSIPSKAWHVIVPGIAWNAGLSPAEEKQVTAYIEAAAKYNELRQH